MHLTQITIENFQSYFDRSSINLNKNLNLLLGTIGAGKSKLFNAFYWNFFGEIYRTENGWCSIDSSNFLSIFNKKSLKDALENDKVKAEVVLNVKSDKDYTVCRYFEIKKKNDEDYNSEKNWHFLNEELIVSFDNSEGNRINIDNHFEARDYIVKKLLPKEISKYIWFQGETLNELIDISNGKSFKDAINYISYIGYYDKNITIVEQLIDKIEKTLRKEKKRDTSNEREFNRISYEIDNLERKLPEFQENLDNANTELQQIERVIDDIDKRLDDINEFIELKNKKDRLERERKFVFEEIESYDKNVSNLFSKHWVLFGTDTLMNAGFDKLHSFQKWFEENQNNNPTGLPYNIPDPKYLKEMLDNLECYICGEKFDKESDAFKNIENRYKIASGEIEEFRQKNREQLAINNKVVDILSNKPTLLAKVKSIKSDIVNNLQKNKELNNRKNEILAKINELNDEITLLQEKHGNKIIDNFSLEKNKYNYNIKEKDIIKSKIKNLNDNIYIHKQDLKRKKEELDKIPTKTNKEYKEEKILTYLYEIQDIYIKTKETEFNKLITKIEDKANEILAKTTKANKVINGRILIDRDSYIIKLIDLDNENNNRDINTGHITLMKMCIINAIVLISNEYKNKSYPFISDAPTSALDDGTTKLYYKILDEEFEQSIVMTKDLFTYKDGQNIVDKSSLKEFDFKNVYIIQKDGATSDLTESNSYSSLKKII